MLSEDEKFNLQAKHTYSYQGAKNTEELIADISVLFFESELSYDAKDSVMRVLQDAYWIVKKKNRKNIRQKYRKNRNV